jgi:HSP20 family protein
VTGCLVHLIRHSTWHGLCFLKDAGDVVRRGGCERSSSPPQGVEQDCGRFTILERSEAMLVRGINAVPSIRRTRDTVDRLFDSMLSSFSPEFSNTDARLFPPVNVWQDEQALYVEAELPGFEMDNIDVTILENRLTISGKREIQWPEQASVLRQERRIGEFSRTFNLPVEIDADKVQANFEHGVLTITLPKAAAAQPRKIEVKPAR